MTKMTSNATSHTFVSLQGGRFTNGNLDISQVKLKMPNQPSVCVSSAPGYLDVVRGGLRGL